MDRVPASVASHINRISRRTINSHNEATLKLWKLTIKLID